MKRLSRVFVWAFSVSSAFAFGNDREPVQWNLGDEGGAASLSEILIRASNTITQIHVTNLDASDLIARAYCSADFMRPLVKFGPFLDSRNQLRCDATTSQGKQGSIRFDLSDILVHRWGNATFPRGVSLRGDTAKQLLATMEAYFFELGPDGFFNRVEQRLESDVSVYEYTDYYVSRTPYQTVGTKNLVCTKEWVYAKGDMRDQEPNYIRCDFIYLYELNDAQRAEINEKYGPLDYSGEETRVDPFAD